METNEQSFPFEITSDPELDKELAKHFAAPATPNIFVGPKRYCLPAGYGNTASTIYHMPVRTEDTFVVTYPRSGTTWTQVLVWLVANDLDYVTAKSIPLTDRYPFLEISSFMPPETLTEFKGNVHMETIAKPATEVLATTPSPRFIKSHLPPSLLPAATLDTAKVVYVARDPRDVVVSFYHFSRSSEMGEFIGDLETYFDLLVRDLLTWSPFFEHVKEAWNLRHHPNMLFLFYEDLIKDLTGMVRRVAEFYGKQYTDEQLAELAEHLRFDNFKKNKMVDLTVMREAGIFKPGMEFVRKGKSGGWRESFTPEMTRRAERWMEENLRDTDLVFPST